MARLLGRTLQRAWLCTNRLRPGAHLEKRRGCLVVCAESVVVRARILCTGSRAPEGSTRSHEKRPVVARSSEKLLAPCFPGRYLQHRAEESTPRFPEDDRPIVLVQGQIPLTVHSGGGLQTRSQTSDWGRAN